MSYWDKSILINALSVARGQRLPSPHSSLRASKRGSTLAKTVDVVAGVGLRSECYSKSARDIGCPRPWCYRRPGSWSSPFRPEVNWNELRPRRDHAAEVTWHTIRTIPGMVLMNNGFDADGTMLWALINTKEQTILWRRQNTGHQ